MPSRHKGHFVQIWRPTHGKDIWPKYVDVEGRIVSTSINRDSWAATQGGWGGVSRELPFRKARFFAKAYSRAGFPVRIVRVTVTGSEVVYTKSPNRKAVRR
jgi:hypothetical protein